MNEQEIQNKIENHGLRNAELIRVLKGKGVGENDVIDVEYHFWSFNKKDAIHFAKRLYDEDFSLLMLSPVKEDEGVVWNVEAGKQQELVM